VALTATYSRSTNPLDPGASATRLPGRHGYCEVASIPTIPPPVAAVMQTAWPVASTPTPPAATPQKPYQTTTNTAQVTALNSSVGLAALVQEIANLTRPFAALRSEHRSRSRTRRDTTRPRQHHSRHGSTSQLTDNTPGPCWYHKKFGSKATRCRSSCTAKQQGNDSSST